MNQFKTEVAQYASDSKVISPQLVAEVSAITDQMSGMLRFMNQIKKEQTSILSNRFSAEKKKIAEFCTLNGHPVQF